TTAPCCSSRTTAACSRTSTSTSAGTSTVAGSRVPDLLGHQEPRQGQASPQPGVEPRRIAYAVQHLRDALPLVRRDDEPAHPAHERGIPSVTLPVGGEVPTRAPPGAGV